jgi:acyl carrier protein
MSSVVPLSRSPINPESTSFPVLAIIHLFEVDDGKLKELIYKAAFWTVRNLWNEEDQSALDKRVESMMEIHTYMVELGYRPQDPQVLLNKLTENLNRCLVRDESTDEAEMAEFDADMVKQREVAAAEMRAKIAKIVLLNSLDDSLHSRAGDFIPEDSAKLEDLGIDSLALVQCAMELEEEINQSVDDDRILACTSFGDLIKLVDSLG